MLYTYCSLKLLNIIYLNYLLNVFKYLFVVYLLNGKANQGNVTLTCVKLLKIISVIDILEIKCLINIIGISYILQFNILLFLIGQKKIQS